MGERGISTEMMERARAATKSLMEAEPVKKKKRKKGFQLIPPEGVRVDKVRGPRTAGQPRKGEALVRLVGSREKQPGEDLE